MQNIRMLAAAALRKNKGQAISMTILMLMTAMFMNIGLTMYFGVGDFYDKRAEELNTAHFAAQQSDNEASTARYDFIKDFPGVTEIETQSILHGTGEIYLNERAVTPVIIADGSGAQAQRMNPPSLVGEHLPLEGDAIYIPYGIFLGAGYEIGGAFTLEFAGEQMEFTVAGSTEEIFFGVSPRLYVSRDVFNEMRERFKEQRFTLISARAQNGGVEALSKSYADKFANLDGGGFLTSDYPAVRSSRVVNTTVGALFIIIFSLIILVVGVIIIRFRINNDIEENMTNIGALKAMGYRNGQIMLSFVWEFGVIAFAGGITGILLAQFILPMAGGVLEPMLGIPWSAETETPHMIISLITVLAVVLLFSLLASRRINILHPLTALRGGTTNHSFKKNPLPLEKSHAGLSFVIAMKNLLLNKKQAITISLITMGLTFASAFALTVNYYVNSDALRQSVILDDIDISAEINDSAHGLDFEERMRALPEVKSIYGRYETKLNIDGKQIAATVIEDFSYAIMDLVDGRFPMHDNEILLGGAAMRDMGVSLGDWVPAAENSNEEMYLIVGTVQTQIEYGLVAVLDVSGFRRINPDFTFASFVINLARGTDGFYLADKLSASESGTISNIFYTRPFLDAQLKAVGGIFSAISIVLLVMVAVVVTSVLYMVVRTTVLRKKRELGIQKALGFTDLQLMNQIALNLLPEALTGVTIGAAAGIFSFNPIYIAFLNGYGIVHSNLFVPLPWVVIMCAALVLLNYAVSLLIAYRIRGISAYSLVTE